MNQLERFNQIVSFQKPDKPVKWYTLGFWAETRQQWIKENGLAEDIDLTKYFQLEYPAQLPGVSNRMPFNPPFEKIVIEENDETRIVQGEDGIISKQYKKGVSMPQWLSFPVTSKEDWIDAKRRLDPDNHDYGENYDDKIRKHRHNDEINMLFMNGIYGFHRWLLGEVNLAYAYFDMPDVIHDMSEHWLKYYAKVSAKIIQDARVDFVIFFEDMAYKTGPLIGPDLFQEFMTPFYKDMISYLKGLGMKNFMVDCDGNVEKLLPLFSDIGINMMDPFEQAAGNDILRIREQYPEMVMWGGIDKRVLNGTKDDIKQEVYSKVPVMWEKGGFIPSIDHSTPPCPMENFVAYLELLDEVLV